MRLLYFVQYFRPEKSSGGVLVEDLLEGFAKQGWEVHVYTPAPTRGVTAEQRKEYCTKDKKHEVLFDGKLTIHRMSLYREGTGFVPRALRYMLFSLQCLWKGLTEPAELVFTGSGPPTQGLVGGLIRRLTKKKFVYNLQDIFPDSMINAGMCGENALPVKIGRLMEKFIYKNADVIITISEDMKKNILEKGADPNKVFSVWNWIDTEQIQPIPREDNALFEELGLDRDKFYVTYAGNLGYVQGIDYVLNAAAMLKDEPQIQFVIFGNGSEEEKLKQQTIEQELTNVHIFPLQPVEKMSEVYSLGDVSLVSCRPGVGSAGMPSKTWIIMAAGTAVLGFFDTDSELARMLQEAQCGVCAQAGDAEALKKQILNLSRNRKCCEQYGKNARKYAEEAVSKDKAVARYIEIIEEIC